MSLGHLRIVPGPGGRLVWAIEARPHVVLRAKRVFARVRATERGTIEMTSTPEVCRDLVWFLGRFPLTITDADRAILEAHARGHVERESAVAAILAEGYRPKRFKMAEKPYDFQAQAAELALRTGSLLLCDELGLGKTVTALAVLTDPRTRPALVVTQANLTRQWEAQAHRFVPGMHVHILEKGTPYDLRNPPKHRGVPQPHRGAIPDVILCNYHKIVGWAPVLAELCKSVVFDEAQELRRGDSAKYTAARHIASSCDVRIGLSATPVYNYGSELHAVVDVLRPDALGTSAEFRREWCGGDGEHVKDPPALGAYVRGEGIMLRRTRSDVRREIPALSVVPYEIPSDEKAIDEVAGAAAELARILLAGPGAGLARGEALHAAEELSMRLRQATGIAKAPYVADFVRLLVEAGEPVVLFGWHRAVYAIWQERLKDLRPAMYTGSESPKEKEASKQSFLAGQSKVLIMSLRAGAGLDGLQHGCRTVVYGELDWSPQVHGQCTGRVHRDGQKDPVAAYYLITDSGSDPVVADVLGIKQRQSEGILDPDGAIVEPVDQTSGANMKRLAEAFLRARGLPIPTPQETTP